MASSEQLQRLFGHILSPSLTSESIPSYFSCNQCLTLSLASFDLFCWESCWLRVFLPVKLTHCLYKQTGCFSFPSTAGLCHSRSWLLVLLPSPRGRGEGKAGQGGYAHAQMALAFVKNQHPPEKDQRAEGLK